MNNHLRLLLFGAILFATVPLTVALALQPQKTASHAQVLSANVTTNGVISNQGKSQLSCSDCMQQGKDGICFNVESKTAYCTNTRVTGGGINVLCRSCGTIKISPPISATPPPGCYYKPIVCTLMCPINNPNCCGERKVLVCPTTTPALSCIPRPPCLDATPIKCMIAEPAGGWCPITTSVHTNVVYPQTGTTNNNQ